METIPLCDLRAQYLSLKDEIDAAIAEVFAEAEFVRGSRVTEFEDAFAAACGTKKCVSCGCGTDALYITLKQLGIGPGDEVITPALSWIASTSVITRTGAKAVFADVEEDFFTISPSSVEAVLTPRTRAVIAVHLYGQPADLEPLLSICSRHGLQLVEDAAQAHLATYCGKQVGSLGIAGAFSFYPSKNLGAFGDGGAIVTSDVDLAMKCRCYASHGSSPANKHEHVMEGINSRLDAVQAAVLLVKLSSLRIWNNKRRRIAKLYDKLLAGSAVVTPIVRPNASHVYHSYVVRVQDRNTVRTEMAKRGVATAIQYPTPLPLQRAYAEFEHVPDDHPIASRLTTEILSLPICPEMSDEQVHFVAHAVAQAVERC